MSNTTLLAPNQSQSTVRCLTSAQRRMLALKLFKTQLQEYLAFDSVVFKVSLGFVGYLAAFVHSVRGRCGQAFLLLSKLHRANWLGMANARAERLAREAAKQASAGASHAILTLYREHIERLAPTPMTARFWKDPTKILGTFAQVLKSPRLEEKGVLVLQYSAIFPLFLRHFDIHRVASRYHVVLEPDWSGTCDINILSYCRFPFPVFVQAFEPRDAQFVDCINSNLIVVPTSMNWWIDHRRFRPLPGTVKDFDVVMNSCWGNYKRHFQFFRALARLKRAGHRLRVLLLGYPGNLTKHDIFRHAELCDVADQVHIEERVPYDDVNDWMNRAKVHVLWSRKEGVNRAIIEGMLAGVPCIVHEGFNYGYSYPYINPQTGCFASERDLPAKLLAMIQNSDQLTPRDWVLANMSCQRATEILNEVIGKAASRLGEPWRGGVAVKVNRMSATEYWDQENTRSFEPDYEFLRTTLRSSS